MNTKYVLEDLNRILDHDYEENQKRLKEIWKMDSEEYLKFGYGKSKEIIGKNEEIIRLQELINAKLCEEMVVD